MKKKRLFRFAAVLVALVAIVFLFSCESEPETIPKSNIQFNLDGNYGESVKYKVAYGRDGNNTEMEFFDTAVLSIPEIEAGTYDWSITAIIDGKAVPVGSGKAETKPGETKAIPVAGSPARISITDVPGGYATAFAVDGNAIEGTSATLWLSEGQHNISFSAAFEGEERGTIAESFTVEKGKAYSSSFKFVEKEIAPKTGTISITASGADADIQILKDGSAITATAVDGVYTLELGSYKAVAKAGNGVLGTYEKSFTIAEGVNDAIVFNGRTIKVTAVDFPVLEEGQTGKLAVTGFEPVAGNTASYWIPVGTKVVIKYAILEGEAEMYSASQEIIVTESSSDITLKYNAAVGTISITAEGTEADIKIMKDGSAITATAVDGVYTLEVGMYKAVATAKGDVKGSIEKEFEVKKDSNAAVVLSGKKLTVTVKDFPAVPAGMTEELKVTGFDPVAANTGSYWIPVDTEVTFEYSIIKDGVARLSGKKVVSIAAETAEAVEIVNPTPVGTVSIKATGVEADIEIFKAGERFYPFSQNGDVYTLETGDYTVKAIASAGVIGTYEKDLNVAAENNPDVVFEGKTIKVTAEDFPALGKGQTEKLTVTGFDPVAANTANYWILVGTEVTFRYEILDGATVMYSEEQKRTVVAESTDVVLKYVPTIKIISNAVDYDVTVLKDGTPVAAVPVDNVWTLPVGSYQARIDVKEGNEVIASKTVDITVDNAVNADVVVEGKKVKLAYTGTPADTTSILTIGELKYENTASVNPWLWYGAYDVAYTVSQSGKVVSVMTQKLTVNAETSDITVEYAAGIPTAKVNLTVKEYESAFQTTLEIVQNDTVIDKKDVSPTSNSLVKSVSFEIPIGEYTFRIKTSIDQPSPMHDSGMVEKKVLIAQGDNNIEIIIQELRIDVPDDGLTHEWNIEGYETTEHTHRWYILDPDKAIKVNYKGMQSDKLRYQETVEVVPSKCPVSSGSKHLNMLKLPVPAVNMDAKLNLTVNGAASYDLSFKDMNGQVVEARNEGGLIVLPSDKYTMTITPKEGSVVYAGRDVEIDLDGAKETPVAASGALCAISINNAPAIEEGDVQSLKIGAFDPIDGSEAHLWLEDGSYDVRYEVRRNGMVVGSATGNIVVAGTDAKTEAFDYSGATETGILKLDVKEANDYDVVIQSAGLTVDVKPETDGSYKLLYGDYDVTVTAKDGNRLQGSSTKTVKIEAAENTLVFDNSVFTFTVNGLPPHAAKAYTAKFSVDGVEFPEAVSDSYTYWLDNTVKHSVSAKFYEESTYTGCTEICYIQASSTAKAFEIAYSCSRHQASLRVFGAPKNQIRWAYSDGTEFTPEILGNGEYMVPDGIVRTMVEALDDGGNVIGTQILEKTVTANYSNDFRGDIIHVSIKGAPEITSGWAQSLKVGNDLREGVSKADFWVKRGNQTAYYKVTEGSKVRADMTEAFKVVEQHSMNFDFDYVALPIYGRLNVSVPAIKKVADITVIDSKGTVVATGNSGSDIQLETGTYTVKAEFTGIIGEMVQENVLITEDNETPVSFPGRIANVEVTGIPEGKTYSSIIAVNGQPDVEANSATYWLKDGSYDVVYTAKEGTAVITVLTGKLNVGADGSNLSIAWSVDKPEGTLKVNANAATPRIEISQAGKAVDVKPADGVYTLPIGRYEVKVSAMDGETLLGEETRSVQIDKGKQTVLEIDRKTVTVSITGVPADVILTHELTVSGVDESLNATSVKKWIPYGTYTVTYSGSRDSLEEGFAEQTFTVGKTSSETVDVEFVRCFTTEEVGGTGFYNLVGVNPRTIDKDGHVKVPSNILGKTVKTVASGAFNAVKDKLVSVELDAGYETVGSGAFAALPNLKWVRVPASLKTVASGAFTGSPLFRTLHVDSKYSETLAMEEGWMDSDATPVFDKDWKVTYPLIYDDNYYYKEPILGLKLLDATGYKGVFKYPDYWEGRPVENLFGCDSQFSSKIIGIELPEKLLGLDGQALYHCSNVQLTQEFILPETLGMIGWECIRGLKLPETQKYLVIPERVDKVIGRAFYDCSFDIMIMNTDAFQSKEEPYCWQGSPKNTPWNSNFKGKAYDQYGMPLDVSSRKGTVNVVVEGTGTFNIEIIDKDGNSVKKADNVTSLQFTDVVPKASYSVKVTPVVDGNPGTPVVREAAPFQGPECKISMNP